MNIQEILFYVFSGLMILCGFMVVTGRNPVSCALSLVLAFFFMAGLFVLLEAYFLAAIQVLVYAGAVMVLFLFIIMLLDIKAQKHATKNWFNRFAGILISLVFMLLFFTMVKSDSFGHSVPKQSLQGTTEVVGTRLYTEFLIPFEVTSILLLAAVLGVVLLSKRDLK